MKRAGQVPPQDPVAPPRPTRVYPSDLAFHLARVVLAGLEVSDESGANVHRLGEEFCVQSADRGCQTFDEPDDAVDEFLGLVARE